MARRPSRSIDPKLNAINRLTHDTPAKTASLDVTCCCSCSSTRPYRQAHFSGDADQTARIDPSNPLRDPPENSGPKRSDPRRTASTVGQAGLVEVPHVTRSPTVAGPAFGHWDYAVCDFGRDAARARRARPDYGARVMQRFGLVHVDQIAGYVRP